MPEFGKFSSPLFTGLSSPYDVTVHSPSHTVYVGELNHARVWKLCFLLPYLQGLSSPNDVTVHSPSHTV